MPAASRSSGDQRERTLPESYLMPALIPCSICVVAGHVKRFLRGSRVVLMSLPVMMTDPSSIFPISPQGKLASKPYGLHGSHHLLVHGCSVRLKRLSAG